MSGGFFRGTSADQDTRFSNKQAKLLKSQKFASELDHLVDMTKVQMDVIRPWIATRATEFLGFEDEVLINFIYGLLDAKEVDGKQIQIQLTGFMEKNTGKFMKELWSLLLSAQKNVSGVPQQFLDAKEEETRKKKAEADRITLELQRMKETEGRELEQELSRKMDGEMDVSRTANTAATLKNSLLRTSEDREAGERLGSEGKNRLSGSPHAVGHSLSPNRSSPLASRSRSKSFSNSRSYSGSPYSSERRKSRTISGSPQPQQRSLSPERRQHSPVHSPRRKHSPRLSPSRRRLPHLMRRSPSAVRHRSPSPAQYRSRSPVRRRSRTPVLRRFPSPYRRRYPSPIRRRSPSPIRRRSPSPIRRRSPSPYRRRSPSPPRRRSPLARSPRYRRRSPLRSPRRRVVTSQNSPRRRNRSRSPYGSRSPPYRSHRSLSRERDGRVNGVESRRYQDGYASQRGHTKRSPDHHILEREDFEHPGVGRKGPESVSRQPLISLRSPQRDARARTRNRVSVLSSPPEKTSSQLDSPLRVKKMNLNEDIRKLSASVSPERPTREQAIRHDTPEISAKELEMDHSRENLTRRDDSLKNRLEHSLTIGCRKKSSAKDTVLEEYSPSDYIKSRKNDSTTRSDSSPRRTDIPRLTQQASRVSEEIEYGPGRPEGERISPSAKRVGRHPSSSDERFSNEKVSLKRSYAREGGRVDEKKRPLSSNVEYCDPGRKSDSLQKFMNRVAKNNQVGHFDSDGEETESYRIQDLDKRKSKRQDSSNVVWNNEMGYASPIDDRKEAKRRKKEEKRLRKEERRRRREERHRRREERRAGKLKAKTVDTVAPPSNYEKKHSDADDSEDGDVDARRDPQLSETEETESEQKKLEIELRKKALESLRAKKAISH